MKYEGVRLYSLKAPECWDKNVGFREIRERGRQVIVLYNLEKINRGINEAAS